MEVPGFGGHYGLVRFVIWCSDNPIDSRQRFSINQLHMGVWNPRRQNGRLADMDRCRAVCGVQALAARLDNIGVGWTSMIKHDDLRKGVEHPSSIQPTDLRSEVCLLIWIRQRFWISPWAICSTTVLAPARRSRLHCNTSLGSGPGSSAV